MIESKSLFRASTESKWKRQGFSYLILLVLIIIVVVTTALVGIMARATRKARFSNRSLIDAQNCRTLIVEVVHPVLEAEGWPRLPYEDWMKPCNDGLHCRNTAHRVSFDENTFWIRAVPTLKGVYIVSIFDENRRPVCLDYRYRPLAGNFWGRN